MKTEMEIRELLESIKKNRDSSTAAGFATTTVYLTAIDTLTWVLGQAYEDKPYRSEKNNAEVKEVS